MSSMQHRMPSSGSNRVREQRSVSTPAAVNHRIDVAVIEDESDSYVVAIKAYLHHVSTRRDAV